MCLFRSTVKEQVAGLFTQKLAEAGYIAVAADAAYQGASGGLPRHSDIPFFRTEDIHGMVDLLSIYPGVDKDRIGLLGICGNKKFMSFTEYTSFYCQKIFQKFASMFV